MKEPLPAKKTTHPLRRGRVVFLHIWQCYRLALRHVIHLSRLTLFALE